MPVRALAQACEPRPSVFDPVVRDTVYRIDDLDRIDPRQFFAENYVTEGMKILLAEGFKRLEGRSPNAPGTFLLSQSMGGGKTHNLIALGLLARNPTLRSAVMSSFHTPGPLGAVRVVTFSGRTTNTPYGLWYELAERLNRREVFRDFYTPPRPPGDREWIELLRGDPVLVMLDELPPYFEAARAVTVGATTLDTITTTALANLLVALNSGHLPNACLVLTDLSGSAYNIGAAAMNQALSNLQQEVNRAVVRIDPVRLNTNELYHILRTRIFQRLPDRTDVEAVADAVAQAVDEARRMDLTTASSAQLRADVANTYPFHPAIRDLYARFKENPGFQQTRALIRLMRIIVARLWQSGKARQQHLIGAPDLDLHQPDVLSEVRQINPTLEVAVAHDVAADSAGSVAEQIDGPTRTDAQEAAKLIFLSSLSQAVNPTLGLTRSEIVSSLAAPGRDVSLLNQAVDQLQGGAWYLHVNASGALLFRNTENLVAKQETYTRGMLRDQREGELREQLAVMFAPRLAGCYQDLHCLPALDQVTPQAERVALIVFRPGETALDEVRRYFDHQQYKNRALFLTGHAPAYEQVLHRAASLRAIRLIIKELRDQGVRETDSQLQDAVRIETREQANFYQACRETFQILHYPSRSGLTPVNLDPRYVANTYEGEPQVLNALKEAYKFRDDTSPDSFRPIVESRLWPAELKEVAWSEIKRRAASDPSWVLHHPRALDDLKAELVRRDTWREAGGFVQRGPFPRPTTSALVRVQQRDDATGEVTLTVTPRHADLVYWSDSGPATTSSPRLERMTFSTTALALSFLAVDSTGEHETGEPVTWRNTLSVRYRLYQRGGQRVCELQAAPRGEIRYTVDGASPETSGLPYAEPFPVPAGARVVLAQAHAAGVTSPTLRVDIPTTGGGPAEVLVDPQKPAVWRRVHRRDATGEVYEWLGLADKHGAEIGGVKLEIARESRWVELRTAEDLWQPATQVREQADLLTRLVAGGNLSLDVDLLRFARGQDLADLVAALRLALGPGEVQQ